MMPTSHGVIIMISWIIKSNLASIVALRAKRAKLLGYKSHADLNLENRMAKTPEKSGHF